MFGVIGGTGLYYLDALEDVESVAIDTPFGVPSGEISIGRIFGKRVAFLPRHGPKHLLLPHEVNYRANVFALKALGVTSLLSVSAIGSLCTEIKPGDFVISEQFLDFLKGKRELSFFGDGLPAHISTAYPVSKELAEQVRLVGDTQVHRGKTYASVEGPRLGTFAESKFLQMAGADVVGMTNIPEVFLAREAQIAYCPIGIVTDFDCGVEGADRDVSTESIIAVYQQSIEKVKELLIAFFKSIPEGFYPQSRESLRGALLVEIEALSSRADEIWEVLSR